MLLNLPSNVSPTKSLGKIEGFAGAFVSFRLSAGRAAVLAHKVPKSAPALAEDLHAAGVAVQAVADPPLPRLEAGRHLHPRARPLCPKSKLRFLKLKSHLENPLHLETVSFPYSALFCIDY